MANNLDAINSPIPPTDIAQYAKSPYSLAHDFGKNGNNENDDNNNDSEQQQRFQVASNSNSKYQQNVSKYNDFV